MVIPWWLPVSAGVATAALAFSLWPAQGWTPLSALAGCGLVLSLLLWRLPAQAPRPLRAALLALLLLAALAAARQVGTAEFYWPFAWRYDPQLPVGRHTWLQLGLALSCVLLALAVLLLGWRRAPLLAFVLALALLWLARWPAPAMWLTRATPTSFQLPPPSLTLADLARGASLYQNQCASCHGAQADGRGPLAGKQSPSPGALGAGLFSYRPAGDVFWHLASGHPAAMPADEAWDVIRYLRWRAWGEAGGRGLPAQRAPALTLRCAGVPRSWDSLRGTPVRVIAHGPETAAQRWDPRMTTVLLTRGASQLDADCVAEDAQAWQAYAEAAGLPGAALAGAQFLLDRQGWLRARWLPGSANEWTSADSLCGPEGRMDASDAGMDRMLRDMDATPMNYDRPAILPGLAALKGVLR